MKIDRGIEKPRSNRPLAHCAEHGFRGLESSGDSLDWQDGCWTCANNFSSRSSGLYPADPGIVPPMAADGVIPEIIGAVHDRLSGSHAFAPQKATKIPC